LKNNISKLDQWVINQDYKGYDPFDALNSPILKTLSKHSKWSRIFFTQLLLRSPINLRLLLRMKPDYNPKAMGLFLSAYSNLYRTHKDQRYLEKLEFFTQWLIENSSKGYSGHCWGYNFDWQNREFYAPKGTPTVVNTAFIGHGFLDAYELNSNEIYLKVARSACDFIINDLNIYQENDSVCFSYTPLDNGRVHNANYLGASLLIRVASLTGEKILTQYAEKAYQFSNSYQMDNGAWRYGEEDIRSWIDGFHTGFNLDALHWHILSTKSIKYKDILVKGLHYYINHFFLKNGTPKYYHNKTYPIDIHNAAQALITLSKLGHYQPDANCVLEKVHRWTIDNMQDPKGYFYYRKEKLFTNKIPYIRWGQAWMLLALSTVDLYNADRSIY